MNTTKYINESELKLQTIEEKHDQEEQTIEKIVNTSPVKVQSKIVNQFNTLGSQSDVTALSKKTKLFYSHDASNKDTVGNQDDGSRHRRNKTEADTKKKNREKDPVYNCLYVPFLQSNGFGVKKSIIQRRNTDNISYSSQKQKITQPLQINSQRSFSQPLSKTQKQQKVLSLPGIKRFSQSTINQSDIPHKRIHSTPKIDGTQSLNPTKIIPSRLAQLKNTTKIQKQQSQQKPTFRQEKNLKNFKLRDRQNKIKPKKATKKIAQWKEINFLQLKTCYFHIEKRMKDNSNVESSKDYSTLNNSSKINLSIKNLKKEILIHQRTPKMPKFPSSADEVSLTIKNFNSIRKNKVSIDNLIKSKNFRVKYVDRNMMYFGQMVNETFDGYGIFIRPDEVYQGTWKQGKRVTGTEIKKGIYFEGNYVDGKKQGFGISYWNQGFDEYSGEWRNGLKNGNGVWKNLDGDQYIGQWINGKVQGYGVHTTVDGQKYEGYFLNFLKHGKGKESFPNGDYFQGNFAQGKPQGQGVYHFHRGEIKYEGSFSKGLRTGKGKLTVPNMFVYEGDFQSDNVQGYGRMTYINNDSYIGQFKQGLRHGNGTFHNTKQNMILTGLWSKGNFFSKSQQKDLSNFQNK